MNDDDMYNYPQNRTRPPWRKLLVCEYHNVTDCGAEGCHCPQVYVIIIVIYIHFYTSKDCCDKPTLSVRDQMSG